MSFGPSLALLRSEAKPSSFKLIDIPEECWKGRACQKEMDLICKTIETVGGSFQASDAYNGDLWFSLLMLSSAAVGFIFFFIVWYNKELQVHPMRLIMYLAFIESTY